MNKKFILSLTLILILSLSFASAQNITSDKTRSDILYTTTTGGINLRDIERVGLTDEYIVYGNAGTVIGRVFNNFTQYQTVISSGLGTTDFLGFLPDGLDFANPHSNRIYFLSTGSDNVVAFEGTNNINTVALNDFTPAGSVMGTIQSIVVVEEGNLKFLYALHDDSQQVNVYRIRKLNTLYSYSYQRTFSLSLNCAINDVSKHDLAYHNARLYLLCGDDGKPEANTIYSYNTVGDLQDIYFLNVPLEEFSGLDIIEETGEFVILPRNVNEFNFFEWEEGEQGDIVTVNGVPYNRSNICISNSQKCTNATIYTDLGQTIIECALEDRIYCSAGCTNIDIGGVQNANCGQLACSNECENPSEVTCETPNTYSSCVLGGDGCLDLNSGLFCGVNRVCVEVPNFNDQCVDSATEQPDLWIKPFITLDYNIQRTNVTQTQVTTSESAQLQITDPITQLIAPIPVLISNFVLKSVTSSVTETYNIVGVQNLQSTDYSAVSCNWVNNQLEIDTALTNQWTRTDNTTIEGNLIFLDTTTQANKTLLETTKSQEIELLIDITNGNQTIAFYDQPYKIVELELSYNNVTRQLLIRDKIYNRYIVNETGVLTSPQDSLDRIVLTNRFIKETKAYNLQANIIRVVNGVTTQNNYYSKPIGYNNNQGSTPDTIVFSSGLRIYQIIQYEQEGFTPYSTTPQTCAYNTLGCKNIRVWANDDPDTTYHFYEDIRTCIQQIDGVSATGQDLGVTIDEDLDALESLFGEPFTQNEKLLIGIITVLFIFGIFTGIFYTTGERIILYAGVMTGTLVLLGFIVFGYIPSWILLLGGVISIWLITRQFIGSGG